MKKALLVASVQSHIAQFHKPLIQVLKEEGYEIHVAARNNLSFKDGLQIPNCDAIFDIPFSRKVLSCHHVQAYQKLNELIEKERYDLISCNTPVAGVLARLAGRQIHDWGGRIIYTAHGFHFFQGGPLSSWLLYYPVEKWMAHYTDTLITINQEDYQLALSRHFHTNITRIHGAGADARRFLSLSPTQIAQFRKELQLENRFVLLCTGELNHNKNQKTILRSAALAKEKIPELLLIVAGNGPQEENLKAEIVRLGLEEHVRMIGYCSHLEWYVNVCDVLISASFREGLPLNILEAMVCQKPVIASINRGHKELIEHEVNGLLVHPEDVAGFARQIIRIYEERSFAQSLAAQAGRQVALYSMDSVAQELKRIYIDADSVPYAAICPVLNTE